jgi:hypothetical protein
MKSHTQWMNKSYKKNIASDFENQHQNNVSFDMIEDT